MQTILVVLHLFLALGIIGLVLLQHGKGADAGAAFGSGASATVFGARGSTSFLSHSTAVLASLFFVTSLALAYYASQAGKLRGIMDQEPPKAASSQNAADDTDSADSEEAGIPTIPSAVVGSTAGQATEVPAPQIKVVPTSAEAKPVVAIKPKVESVVAKPVVEIKPQVEPIVAKPVVEIKPQVEPIVAKPVLEIKPQVNSVSAEDKPVAGASVPQQQ